MIQLREEPEHKPGEANYSWELDARLPQVAALGDAAVQLSNLPKAKATAASTPIMLGGLLGSVAMSAALEAAFGPEMFSYGILVLPATLILVPTCLKAWAVSDKHWRMHQAVEEVHRSLKPAENKALTLYNVLSDDAAQTAKKNGYSEEEKSRVLNALLLDHAAELEKQADQLEATPIATGINND